MSLTASKYGAKAILKGKITAEVFDTAQQMPGWSRWKDGSLMFEVSGRNLEFLRERHPYIQFDEELTEELKKNDLLKEEAAKVRAEKHHRPPELDLPFKTRPFDHQLKALGLSLGKHCFGYFMEQGTGKTKLAIDNFSTLYIRGEIDRVLIIAPNGVHRQWILEQVPAHIFEDIDYKAISYQSGRNSENSEIFKKFDGLKILAMNVECFSAQSGLEFAKKFLTDGKSMVIVDESSRIKNMAAKRTKNILSLRDDSTFRLIMSGTPVTKGVEDLYSQFMFLDPKLLGFNSFYTFRNRFCIMGGFEQKQIVGYRNLAELTKLVDGHTFRVLKDDCLDLPERVFCNYFVPFEPEQQRIYNELRKNFIVELGDGKIASAALAITRLIRLQQILCGRLPTEDGVQQIPTNRLDCMMEAVKDMDGKIIIWCRGVEDIRDVKKRLDEEKIGAVTYFGETTPDERTAAIEKFRNDDSVRVFIANPETGGTGLNLTVANFVIWYSLSFNLEHYLQANDRCHRIGQTKKVTYVHLVTPGSLDLKIASSLQQKKALADTVLDIRELLE